RQDEVEDDRVGRREPGGGVCLRRGGGGVDLVPRAAEIRRECPQKLGLVVDDEDVRAPLHGTVSTAICSAGRVTRAHVPPPSRGSSASEPPFAAANPCAIAR